MIQFPTRLPPLFTDQIAQKDDAAASAEDIANSNGDIQIVNVNPTSTTAAKASTAPCEKSAFDYTLHRHSQPGIVGKLQVFKSGKMQLVLAPQPCSSNDEDPSHSSPAVHMVVNQGLAHTFRQEAVSINLENGEYKTVGTVEMTLVVTPNLSNPQDSVSS